MALRGKKPVAVEGRAKVMVFAPAGFGKSEFSARWPRPYFVDTERGAERGQYVDAINAGGGAYVQLDSLDEIISEVGELAREKHDYRTLIIDPVTVPYAAELDRSAQREGTEFGRHKIGPDRKMKRLLGLLVKLDMSVVLTAHAKSNWVTFKNAQGKEERAVDGSTFDAFPKTDYALDLVLEGTRVHPNKDRVARVIKSRLRAFPEFDTFAFSYDAFADRYGRAILERDAVPLALVTKEDAAELRTLIVQASIGTEDVEKWLKKAGVEEVEDLPADIASKCIAFCRSRVATAAIQ